MDYSAIDNLCGLCVEFILHAGSPLQSGVHRGRLEYNIDFGREAIMKGASHSSNFGKQEVLWPNSHVPRPDLIGIVAE